MLSKLRLFSKYPKNIVNPSILTNMAAIANARFYSNKEKPDVIDVDYEDMMFENEPEGDKWDSSLSKDPELRSTGVDGAPIAPVDINPWVQEEELKEGTVLEETIERKQIISQLPEPPKDRSGEYQFKGIKIVMPKKALTHSTYRFRLDAEDMQTLADDTRICKFDR